MAVPVLDAVLTEAKAALGGDPVVAVMRDVISPETIEAGEPIRALDALIVARQLHAALPKPPPLVSF